MRLGETDVRKMNEFYARNEQYVRGRIARYNPDTRGED